MKKRRKGDKCLNCGAVFEKQENYCPKCGQINQDNNISFGALASEFISNYFSFDSRIGRSIKPFFLRPGSMTLEFVEGKRIKFANPIRWYFLISLFHFYFFTLVNVDEEEGKKSVMNFTINGNDVNQPALLVDSLLTQLDSVNSRSVSDSISEYESEKENSWDPITDYEIDLIQKLNETDSFTFQQIYDSLKVEDKPFIDRLITKQFVRINKSGTGQLRQYVLSKIPITVFFILPFYALLLKLFFFRKGLYVKHLVHTLHIHSFFFLILGIVWILELLGWIDPDIGVFIAFLLVGIYIILSFRRVYQQKYWLLITKLVGIGLIYSIIVSIFLLAGMVVSLALF